MESNIRKWREDLGRMEVLRKGTQVKDKVVRELERRYKIKEKGTLSVSTMLKDKLRAGSMKVKQYEKQCSIFDRMHSLKTSKSNFIRSLVGRPLVRVRRQTQWKSLLSGLRFGRMKRNTRTMQTGLQQWIRILTSSTTGCEWYGWRRKIGH